jgi:16S rRNA (cytosine1402-N4)-methyltransferase
MTQEHVTVLLNEAVQALVHKKDGVYVDATFGRGGHSRAILDSLSPYGRLIAFDQDPEAIQAARSCIHDQRFSIVHANFESMSQYIHQPVDGVLLDLGVSSPQIDTPERGFSFRFDAPLDMRMDNTRGITVADWLNQATEKEISDVLWVYGEERFSKKIARVIVQERMLRPIQTTYELASLVKRVIRIFEPGQHPATRTFQALRIWINHELDVLEQALQQSLYLLSEGGRLAVISFHSLEDRLVKQFMRRAEKPDMPPAWLPIKNEDLPQPILKRMGKAVRPSLQEIQKNSRSRSAIMRLAERTGTPYKEI